MTGEKSGQPPLLSCRSVSKYFGAMAAVDKIDFDLLPGEILGIGGPNGAGKTTLFDVISGLTGADSGSIRLNGEELLGKPAWIICHLGVARTFQLNAGFDTLSAEENVTVAAYFGHENRVFPRLTVDRETARRVESALDFVGMAHRGGEIVRNMSVLDRKLLMIAGAVATSPRVILMDEPVGGLNPEETDSIVHLVRRLRDKGTTVVIIEHVMRFLVELASRILIMHHGEKIYEGTPAGLANDRTVVDVYLGEGTSSRLRQTMNGGLGDGGTVAPA